MGYKPHSDSGHPSTSPFTPTSTQMANKRSIPLLIASSMEGLRDGSEKIPHLPPGIPGSDLGQQLQLRLQGQNAHINPATGSYITDSTTPETRTSNSSGNVSCRGSDQTLSDTIFAFPTSSGPSADRLNDTLLSKDPSSHLFSSQTHTYVDINMNSNKDGSVEFNTNDDQALWDMINGNTLVQPGQDLDLDFSAFLQSIQEDGSAI